MKVKKLLFTILLITHVGFAQTTLFSENFETGNTFTLNTSDLGAATTYNTWLMNNSYTGGSGTIVCLGFPFSFTVINTPAQPASINGSPSSNYMHITAQAAVSSGINNASYAPSDGGTCISDESNFSKMTTSIATTGYSDIDFNFWFLADGSASAYGEVYYSIDNGMTWILKQSTINNVTSWTQATLNDVAWDNQPNLQFAFRFVNTTASTASNFGFAVDEITITENGSLSIYNPSLSSTFIYPNPTKEEVAINFDKVYEDIEIEIVDITGKKINKKQFTNTKDIKLQLLGDNGLYFLTITADSEKMTYKIVKQ